MEALVHMTPPYVLNTHTHTHKEREREKKREKERESIQSSV